MAVNMEQPREVPVSLLASLDTAPRVFFSSAPFGNHTYNELTIEEAFVPGHDSYRGYLISPRGNEHDFSAVCFLSFIDSFSAALTTHCSDEIATLLDLSRFGDKLPIAHIAPTWGRTRFQHLPRSEALTFLLLNLDLTFGRCIWSSFPPMP